MIGLNDDHALKQSSAPRGLKSAARRCLFALLKFIRRVPRELHALLVLALSAICVTIISVRVVLSNWQVSPRDPKVALWRCVALNSVQNSRDGVLR